ncbi:MAG: hypothetical protein ACRBG0_01055 [Lewinella sp.]|jgi:hypothetical protein|uniref:hypothetical protein n=1 Tax=Lewinella sp. TaxID=2004506 RepID=UPI003D6AEE05
MNFIQEIRKRYASDAIESIRQTTWKNYGNLLFGSRINSFQEFTDFQASFLSLMDEKWVELIYPLIQNNVKAEFDDWYEEGGSYKEIRLQAIDLRELESGMWQLLFEDDNVDVIVHLYMKEWEFDYTVRTG